MQSPDEAVEGDTVVANSRGWKSMVFGGGGYVAQEKCAGKVEGCLWCYIKS